MGMVLGDDRYELVELLGEGGMAWVYRGIHKGLERDVAVKLLKSAPAAMVEEQTLRFEREARLASRLNHPHILSIVDFGRTPAGLMYMVTEYIKGKPLNEVLWEDRPMSMARVVDIYHQVLAAIDEAHGAGVIHRDIKPENIIVNQLRSGEDFVKVLDFGIAVLTDRRDGKVTQAGAFIGTPGFMSPEQILGEEATERSDVYALGVLLYEMLAGRAAFEHDSPMGVMTMQLDGDLAPLSEIVPERELPPELDDVVARAIAREPRDRYASVGELRNGLFESTSRMSQIDFDCASCSRPIDPVTGLCSLHRRASSTSRPPKALSAARTEVLPPAEMIRIHSQPPPPVRVEPASLQDEGVVGRETEHEQVASFLGSDRALLVVTGASGAGKTTLTKSIERVGAQDVGIRVFRTGPDPVRSMTPWFPVRDLVGQALGCGHSPGSPKEYGQATAERGFSDVDEAGLHLLFGFDTDHAPRGGPARRNAVHAAATRALAGRSNGLGGPWVIAEDAHEYDNASIDFLRALGALANRTTLKVVATVQRDPGGWGGEHVILELGPLATKPAGVLVDRLFTGVPSETRERVTGAVVESGLPAHAVEAFRLFVDGGEPIGSLRDVLAARLDRLSPGGLGALRAVSMLGSQVPVETLWSILDEDQLRAELELLTERGLIETDSRRLVSPAAPLVAHAVLDDLSVEERRTLGTALLSQMTDADASVFLLARLADEAGQTERAVELFERAGDEAARLEDVAGAAMVHYRRASHLVRWELLMSEEDEAYLRIALKMGRALSNSGHRKAAEVVYKEIIAAAGRHPGFAESAREGLGTLIES
ncbi:MAG: protein kinase [Deltaproteobacteria bacterium]|nr:protein kinase [Deltaproteobacteria bacterium]